MKKKPSYTKWEPELSDLEYTFEAGDKNYTAIVVLTKWVEPLMKYAKGTIKILIFEDYIIQMNTPTKAGDLIMDWVIEMPNFYKRQDADRIIRNDIINRLNLIKK